MTICHDKNCKKQANFGFPDKKERYCHDHKSAKMKNVYHKTCKWKDCEKTPSFNFPGEKSPLYCGSHAKSDMVSTRTSGKCKRCKKTANYNFPEETKPLFCKNHADKGMIPMYGLCKEKGCLKQAVCNIPGKKGKIYCKSHAKLGMKYVSGVCIYEDCCKLASFGDEKDRVRKFCAGHKDDDHVNLNQTLCSHKNCKTRACFGLKKYGPTRCYSHKTRNMINLTETRCIIRGCENIAYYNFPGENKKKYCKNCKKDGMMVVRKRCDKKGCKTTALYKTEDGEMRCSKHKTNEMKHITFPCTYENCNNCSCFGYIGNKIPTRCFSHKNNDMLNISSNRCALDGCDTITRKDTYEGYCFRCFAYLFPDKPIPRGLKTKERETVKFVKEEFPDFDWVADKRVQDGCSLRRPDLLVDFGSHILVVEIDENAHRSYESICENKRMVELFIDVGQRPIVFIRFNPDGYLRRNEDGSETKIKSPWKPNKMGLVSISDKEEWDERLETLAEAIDEWSDPDIKIKKSIEVESLFFDGCEF